MLIFQAHFGRTFFDFSAGCRSISLGKLAKHWAAQDAQFHQLYDPTDQLLYWTGFTLAFFGFLRVGELVPDCTNPAEPPLSLTDVQASEAEILLRIVGSTTDPFRRGNTLHLYATGENICPARAVSRYLADRPTSRPNAAFLLHRSGEALTRRQFIDSLQKCLIAAGVPTAELYTAHSFRIGAATTAALNGVPEWLIQACGRWSSDCFRLYTRALPAQLRQVAHALSSQ